MKICNECLEEKDLSSFDKTGKVNYRSTCRKCRNKKNRENYFNNEANREKTREYQKAYQKKKRESDLYYKLYGECLTRIRRTLRKDEQFISHIEKLFTDDMTWENYGVYWEIDHIIPALKMLRIGYSIDEVNKFENLRPLKCHDNRSRLKKTTDEYKTNWTENRSAQDKEYNLKNADKIKEYQRLYRLKKSKKIKTKL